MRLSLGTEVHKLAGCVCLRQHILPQVWCQLAEAGRCWGLSSQVGLLGGNMQNTYAPGPVLQAGSQEVSVTPNANGR